MPSTVSQQSPGSPDTMHAINMQERGFARLHNTRIFRSRHNRGFAAMI